MFRPRVIPVLLLNHDHLVKSTGFKNYRYIGDPINAVKIFNELKADELVFLDISATKNQRCISSSLVRSIAEEADMPFCVGGGIRSLNQIRQLISCGAEKVIISSEAVINPGFIKSATSEFGTSTISICVDVKNTLFGNQFVYTVNGSRKSSYNPLEFALLMEENGAGELIIQSIDQDGKMKGYDLISIKKITDHVKIPVVALGGAGSVDDFKKVHSEANATGMGAGSLFVYYGSQKGVLLNYPSKKELHKIYA